MTRVFSSAELAAPRDLVLAAAVPLTPRNPITALTQVRRTMEQGSVEELAQSILAQGQHTPGVVVALNPDEAAHYVQELNELWGTNHRLSQMVQIKLDGEGTYLVAIAGHRRLRATELAIAMYEAGHEAGPKFTGRYLCDIYHNLSVEEAVTIQFHENRHHQVPLQEEVSAAICTWRFMRKRHPELTRNDFARVVGRTPGWVTNVLRFSTLPESVQVLIEPNGEGMRVSYQLLVQVARLIEAEYEMLGRTYTEEEIHRMVVRLLLQRVKPAEFTREVSKRIEQLRSGQGDLLLTSGDERSVRRIAVPELVRAAHSALGYWHSVERLRRSGAFAADSPFGPDGKSEVSPQSPMRLALRHVEVLMELVPHLAQIALRERRYRKRLERAAKQLNIPLAVFEALAE